MLTTKPLERPERLEPDLDEPVGTESIADAHARIAIEQSAMHAARLAIARWRSGSVFFPQRQVDAALRPSVQAAWYAQAQKNFQQWLECGGFSERE